MINTAPPNKEDAMTIMIDRKTQTGTYYLTFRTGPLSGKFFKNMRQIFCTHANSRIFYQNTVCSPSLFLPWDRSVISMY